MGIADITGVGLSANPAINGKDVDSFLRTFLLGKNGFRSEKKFKATLEIEELE